jgi:hypothetical protein
MESITIQPIKRPAHRPTIWTEEKVNQLAEDLIKYSERPLYTLRTVTKVSHKGNEYQEEIKEPSELPTIEKFCNIHGIDNSHFYQLAKENDNLSRAITYMRNNQKNMLIQNGMNKTYDSRFASLVAINLTDMRNTVHTESASQDKFIDALTQSVGLLISNKVNKQIEQVKPIVVEVKESTT